MATSFTHQVNQADVQLWGTKIGSVSWDIQREIGFFSYDKPFLKSGIQLSPIQMPLSEEVYSFPALNRNTYKGIPGLLADALPDKFGNLLINQWLQQQGRDPKTFSPVERLCYMGKRGMGGLEFTPSISGHYEDVTHIQVDKLVSLANRVLSLQDKLDVGLFADKGGLSEKNLRSIISVGTSAGGARAKAVIAWDKKTNQVMSGQLPHTEGFEYYLLKFDGVAHNKDKELCDPLGFGRTEYAYYLMAREAAIDMNECRLLEENGRAHFMTKRFDRLDSGGKLHMQSLCAIAHYDFNMAGAYSYEQAMQVMKKMDIVDLQASLEQQYRRMIFNIAARNQDDHTKNIAFLMDRSGQWSLSPAFDVTYSYNPEGEWTSQHQMSINGKRDDFVKSDLIQVAKVANLSDRKANLIINEVLNVVGEWSRFANKAGVDKEQANEIAKYHRLKLGK
ncbi:MAG: type II toxin-antitoxin system HipA family toxin [Pseudomonadales bacterium]|nr:type II toxin-antitoxin system HipA family toxin [Pseudomonadales bacterium]